MPTTLAGVRQKLNSQTPLTAITAYDYTTALSARRAGGIDIVFVLAEEVARCALGLENAASVTLSDMIHHTRAVARGVSTYGSSADPIVIAELPMGSYEVSVEQALTSALSLLKSYPPANGVLLRGGKELAPAIQKLADAGIMTVARMGACTSALKLHSVFALESTTTEGNAVAGDGPVCVARTLECARELLADAQALDGAGVGAVVLEGVAAAAAQKMGAVLMAPAIGLGSGRECAGQFVVQSELLGMRIGERVWAKWHKKYDIAAERAVSAISKWVKEVEVGVYPGKELWTDMRAGEDVQFRQILAPSTRKTLFCG